MAREMKDSGILWIGEIPSSWDMRRLRFLCNIQTGNQDTQDHDPEGEYPFYVRSPIVERSARYTFDGPAILMAGDGVGAGKVFHFVDGKYACHQRVYSLQGIKDISRQYLFYYLQNRFYVSIETANSKSTVDSVRLNMLQDFPVVFPILQEQERIVRFLKAECALIDSVIEQTRASIEEYKKLKQAVITQAVTKGIRPGRRMKESGIEWIGEIPEGWNSLRLKYCTYVRARLGWKGLKAEEYVEEGFPLLSAFNIINSKVEYFSVNYISQERYDESPEIMLSEGDILLVKDGAGIGKCAIVESLLAPSTTNGSLAVISVTDYLVPKFLYYYFLSSMFQAIIDRLKAGMGVPHLFQADLRELQVVYGSEEEQAHIIQYLDVKCAEIDRLIDAKQTLLSQLKTYKNSLIYEYVTGKKEVTA